MLSREGQKLKLKITSEIKKCDQEYKLSPNINSAIQRLSLSRSLKLLFNDQSQILVSQLLLAEQYLNQKSYELSSSYASEILQKDESFAHRLRAEIVQLKNSFLNGQKGNVLECIQSIRKKYSDTEVWNSQTHHQLVKIEVKVHKSMKQYDRSISILQNQMKQLKSRNSMNTIQYAELLSQNANTYFLKEEQLKASSSQKQAINIYQIYTKISNEQLIKMYLILSKYQQKAGQNQEEYQSLLKAEGLHRLRNYEADKLLIDIKKKQCNNLERREQYSGALKQFDGLRELVYEKYGSFSLEMADTKKRIARIYQNLGKKSEAMNQYSEAANIYNQNKDKKSQQQCRNLMHRLHPNQLRIHKSIMMST